MKKNILFLLMPVICASTAIAQNAGKKSSSTTQYVTNVTCVTAQDVKKEANDVIIASWNIENLFDDIDDPKNDGDNEFTPSSWRRWTTDRYRLKLTNCAEVISMMQPDVMVIAEVENRHVLEDLCEVLDKVYNYPMPNIIHKDSTDARGIEVAMISRLKPTRTTWIKPGTGLRDTVAADFSVGGKKFTVLGNHWKSRFGDKKQADATRSFMASKARAHWLHLLDEDPAAAVIMTGDFNDDVDDEVPLMSGGFSTNRLEVIQEGRKLYSLSSALPVEKRRTYFYSQTKTWNSYDQMNVSRGLLKEGEPASAWYTSPEFFLVFATEKQIQKDFYGAPYPFRRVGTKGGQKILNGYSDHFPILLTIKPR